MTSQIRICSKLLQSLSDQGCVATICWSALTDSLGTDSNCKLLCSYQYDFLTLWVSAGTTKALRCQILNIVSVAQCYSRPAAVGSVKLLSGCGQTKCQCCYCHARIFLASVSSGLRLRTCVNCTCHAWFGTHWPIKVYWCDWKLVTDTIRNHWEEDGPTTSFLLFFDWLSLISP